MYELGMTPGTDYHLKSALTSFQSQNTLYGFI